MRIFTWLVLLFISNITNAQNNSKGSVHGGTQVERVNFFQSSLMNKYDIKYLKLDLNVEPNVRAVAGSCFYRCVAVQPIDTFAIEFKDNMTLDSVIINGISRTFTRNSNHIYVNFTTPIPAGSSFTTKFYYSGTVINGLAYGNITSIGLKFAGTVSESFQAREWYPAKQFLNYKIDSTDIWLTTTNPYVAGANGLLKAVVSVGTNKKQYRWSTGYPMNYYMPCFAVGNYRDYRNYAKPSMLNGDSILVQHLLVDSNNYFNAVKAELDKTPVFIEKFSELFTLYPFWKEKYGHLHAFIGGGMEHQTMSTMQGFGASLIAHELAHQWFGDHVTCGSWQDIWLNESFATYGDYLMNEYFPTLYPSTAASVMQGLHNDVMSSPGGSVYIPATDAYNENRIFSGRLTYNKGAGVLHNLRFEMQSDTLFFRTLRTYQTTFADSFAFTPDFKAVAEQVSGKNLTDFFNQWIYGEGYPTYNVGYYKWGADTLVLNVSQTTSMPTVTPLFKGLMEYKVSSAQGDTVIILNQTANNQTFKIRYTKVPTNITVDPNNWVINAVGQVLPVKYINLSGEATNNHIDLQWAVAAEENVKRYEIQRSADGINFFGLSSIPAHGNTNQQLYNYTDTDPLAVGYYRVQVEDKDGSYRFSNVIKMKSGEDLLSVRYNEETATLKINAFSEISSKLQVKIFSLDGRLLQQLSSAVAPGSNQLSVSLHGLVRGMYVVHVVTSDEDKVVKVRR